MEIFDNIGKLFHQFFAEFTNFLHLHEPGVRQTGKKENPLRMQSYNSEYLRTVRNESQIGQMQFNFKYYIKKQISRP